MAGSTPVPPSVTRPLATLPSGPRHSLPPELIAEILAYLDQVDLRSFAAASRLFYASAWRAGLYLHLNILLHQLEYAPDGITAVKGIVGHMLQKGLSLSVTANLHIYRRGTPMEATSWDAAYNILSLLSSALPILVYLSISVPDYSLPIVAAALRHPAPAITSFDLHVDQGNIGASSQAPTDLFAGSAHMLRQLALRDIPLGNAPVPAFSCVESVTLTDAGVHSDIEYARHFPRLRCLRLSLHPQERLPPPPSCHLHGTSLRKLTIDNSHYHSLLPSILRSAKLGEIISVTINGGHADWTDPVWTREHDGLFSVRVAHFRSRRYDVAISVVPEHRRWRRAYNMDRQLVGNAFPISDMPGLSDRLEYLRMDSVYVEGLLECRELALDALRELRVDFDGKVTRATTAWLPDWLTQAGEDAFSPDKRGRPSHHDAGLSRVDCSALQTLTLFAVYAVLHVAPRDVAFLGYALAQCARRKDDRASLVLVGVELAPHEHSLLDEVFSEIRPHDFVCGDSLLNRDSGLLGDVCDR